MFRATMRFVISAFIAIIVVFVFVSAAAPASSAQSLPTYRTLGNAAVDFLENKNSDGFWAGNGWHLCVNRADNGGNGCGTTDQDWGADSLTYSLWLHWTTTKGSSVAPIMASITSNATDYSNSSNWGGWSDVPMWDSIAGVREYQVTGNSQALTNAESAFTFVDSDLGKNDFASGYCPQIHYQLPHAGGGGLKTLETDSNYIKAAILLYQTTGIASYLTKAETEYAGVRSEYLEPDSPMYTVYVWDNGTSCLRVRNQFFSSVNGNMLWNAHELGIITGNASYNYSADATASENYVISSLSDSAGVYESLIQENDAAEEMVEAMWTLANDGDAAAKNWILSNMSAAASALDAGPSGDPYAAAYGRFFGGRPPAVLTSTWASAGGISLAFAASALDPAGTPSTMSYWNNAVQVTGSFPLVTSGTYPITFTGKAISILGTLGQSNTGHAEVLVDGVETNNNIGIDQHYGTAGTIPGTVLFSWRWPTSGTHTITISPPVGNQANSKQGNYGFQMSSYYYVP
jgi:hypothetical protein